jgi:hypothetical protein
MPSKFWNSLKSKRRDDESMSKPPRFDDWNPIGEAAAREIMQHTTAPNVIFSIGTNNLPGGLQKMPGLINCYVSSHLATQSAQGGLTVGAEMNIARAAGGTTKNYNYLLATNSAGDAFMAGPYRGYGHHATSGQTVPIESLFGQHPLAPKK